MEIVSKTGNHIYMSPEEIDSWYAKIEEYHKTYLQEYGIQMPGRKSSSALWLVFLAKHQGKLVHKDTISAFVNTVDPKSGKDQQVRHLGGKGWYILNKGDKIPGEEKTIPSGYHVLLSLESPKPSFLHKALKRAGRISAQNFDQLKVVYGSRCATCGSPEGKPHLLEPNKRTVLHQGHMDPHKALTLENTIPQCELCNQTYKEDYVFDNKGRVIAIASAGPVLRASKEVKEEVKKLL